MQAIALILLLLLAGCSEYFPVDAKLEEMNKLKCKPADMSECIGWDK